MTSKQSIEKVFFNDYIMTDILRRLEVQQQFEIQKICQRFKFLITTCVWRRDLKVMQMHGKHLGNLVDNDFFELLQLNAVNMHKLFVEATYGFSFGRYFAVQYENLLELKISNYCPPNFEELSIFANCPKLEIFHYDADEGSFQPSQYLFKSWQKLTNLKVLILKNFFGLLLYEDICELASKVHIEHLELYNVRRAISECESDVTLLKMKVIRLEHCTLLPYQSDYKFAKIIEKCPNIEEIKLHPSGEFYKEFYKFTFPCLERLSLDNCDLSVALTVLKNKKIKSLSASLVFGGESANEDEIREICSSVESISVQQVGINIWQCFFLPNFKNLLQLQLHGEDVNDDVLRLISLNSPQLKELSLERVHVSGKYINNLANLRRLRIDQINTQIPWYNLFVILRDLKFLDHLIVSSSVIRNNLSMPRIKHLGNSLKMLECQFVDANFWKEILLNCEESLQNVQTFSGSNKETYKSLYKLFKNLTSLTTNSLTYGDINELPATLLSLKFHDFSHWPNIFQIFKSTCVEKLYVRCFNDEDDYADSDGRQQVLLLKDINDKNIFKHIRKVFINAGYFSRHAAFWMQCFEKCPKFQLSIVGEISPQQILEPLDSLTMKSLTALYINRRLGDMKTVLGVDTNGSPKIPIFILDKESPLWDSNFFYNEDMIHIFVK